MARLVADDSPSFVLRVERLPDGTRYALIGAKPAQPAPTLFVLQGDIDVARREPIYTEVARLLALQGFVSVVIDAPGHGEDHRPDEPTELAAWNWRVNQGQDLVGGFVARARSVLDHLIREKITDPDRVAACGTSRGGFLAFQLAAHEPRIRCVGGISPVTDLLALREFNATTNRAAAEALALARLAPQLAGRPAWICIGNNDARVSTAAAITFSRALVAGAPPDRETVPVELLVHSGPGHRSTLQDHERLAAWLLAQFGP
jgi:dienelactone hydrolase